MDIHFPDSLEPDEEEDTPINGGDVVWYPQKKKTLSTIVVEVLISLEPQEKVEEPEPGDGRKGWVK